MTAKIPFAESKFSFYLSFIIYAFSITSENAKYNNFPNYLNNLQNSTKKSAIYSAG